MDDVVVVGGGIVGVATAYELLRRWPDRSVTLLEAGDDLGTVQTGHNSGVLHAGLYYPAGSLKARLCREGTVATQRFCDEHGIDYRTLGKLVVATDDAQTPRLEEVYRRAVQNGVEVRLVEAAELRELEPQVSGVRAIHSPTSAIVDFRRVVAVLAEQVRALGGEIRCRSAVRGIVERAGSASVHVESDTGDLRAREVVVAVGAQADRLARLGGAGGGFRIVPFRGEYFQLPQSLSDLVHHLVYPVPDPSLPFLGVHLTPQMDGRVTVGPNALLGLSRTDSERARVNVRDVVDYLGYPGFWKFASRNVGPGWAEMRAALFRQQYARTAGKYLPAITSADLRPYPAGVRAQAIYRDGRLVEDFLLRETARQLHVCNAPSPAATSAPAIARVIADRLSDRAARRS